MATPLRSGPWRYLRRLERDSQDLADLDQVGVADPVPVGSEQPWPQIAVAITVLRDAEQCVAVDDAVLRKSGVVRTQEGASERQRDDHPKVILGQPAWVVRVDGQCPFRGRRHTVCNRDVEKGEQRAAAWHKNRRNLGQ